MKFLLLHFNFSFYLLKPFLSPFTNFYAYECDEFLLFMFALKYFIQKKSIIQLNSSLLQYFLFIMILHLL